MVLSIYTYCPWSSSTMLLSNKGPSSLVSMFIEGCFISSGELKQLNRTFLKYVDTLTITSYNIYFNYTQTSLSV